MRLRRTLRKVGVVEQLAALNNGFVILVQEVGREELDDFMRGIGQNMLAVVHGVVSYDQLVLRIIS